MKINLKSKWLNLNTLIIISLMVLGLILRTYYLRQNKIVFAYDQARDAYIASQITQGDLKILGPPVSLGGFYHGVFYYYFIAIPYYLSHGNPILPIIFISVFNIAAIPLVFLTGKRLFNSKVGILSAVLYTISFDIIQYSNWLSNPALAVPCSVLFYYGLTTFLFTPKKNLGAFLTALGYGLCFQSQFFLGYLIIPIVFCLFFFKIKPTKKHIWIFIITTAITISTMVLSYFKFGFTFIDGFKAMSSGKDQFSYVSSDFSIPAKLVLVRFVENFYRTVFPFNSFYTAVFVIFCLYSSIKNKNLHSSPLNFLWIFLISQALIIPFGGDSTPYINVGLQLPAIIISALFLIQIIKRSKYIGYALVFLFCLFSLKNDFQLNPQGSLIFSIKKELTLKNEIEAIDYTYQDSNGQPFSINTITSPYWINTLWSYIYQWHGQNKYGYLPSFHGRNQAGQLGNLPATTSDVKYSYLIIEPNTDIPQYLIDSSLAYEDSFSQVIETRNFNGVLVQKRQFTLPVEKIHFVQ